MLNLDTHILLHALGGNLKPREKRLLSSDTWSISAIVLWEICKLAELGRIVIDVDDADIVRALQRIHTWPLTLEIGRQSCRLDFGGDPVDQIIAATSVIHRVPLVTRDRIIRKSKITPLALP